MRILGLDFGSKTVGVAITDELLLTAQGLEIIRRERETKLRRTYSRLLDIIKEYSVEKIVLGLPLNMDDTRGERAEKTLEFKKALEEKSGIPVILWDERLTTVEAIDIMNEAGIPASKRELYVDKIAAMLILEDYLANSGEQM